MNSRYNICELLETLSRESTERRKNEVDVCKETELGDGQSALRSLCSRGPVDTCPMNSLGMWCSLESKSKPVHFLLFSRSNWVSVTATTKGLTLPSLATA